MTEKKKKFFEKVKSFKTGKKNKWLAALLNFVLPGLGYFYAGTKRKEFNFILMVGMTMLYAVSFLQPEQFYGFTGISYWLWMIGGLVT